MPRRELERQKLHRVHPHTQIKNQCHELVTPAVLAGLGGRLAI